MKTIIAGGRNYALTTDDHAWLDTLNITTVVSGGATGADFGGEQWAKSRGVPIVCFEANWTAYGKAAVRSETEKWLNTLMLWFCFLEEGALNQCTAKQSVPILKFLKDVTQLNNRPTRRYVPIPS